MNEIISTRILALVASGMPLPAAFDAVLGEGAYLKMAGEIYESMVSK